MKRDIENLLGYHINVVSHFIQNQYNQKLREHDLTMAQSKVLYFLSEHGEQAQGDMQKRLYIKGSSMNGLVDSLLKKELIHKRQSPDDRRTKLISLTDKGSEIEGQLWSLIDGIEKQLGEGFTTEEQQVIISWLKKMKHNVESLYSE
ncbi:MarR family transcriptional regulator [Pontibacillus salipaludis]|uniref:MarR family winged helix-turn-helix transcriptional regulator n=1 Tax=Pontibacillus salipaludis TaxID=1697394 RepID=UPI0031E68C6E